MNSMRHPTFGEVERTLSEAVRKFWSFLMGRIMLIAFFFLFLITFGPLLADEQTIRISAVIFLSIALVPLAIPEIHMLDRVLDLSKTKRGMLEGSDFARCPRIGCFGNLLYDGRGFICNECGKRI